MEQASPVGPVDHENSMSGELRSVGAHLPVVLHDDLITDIELEDDHRPSPWIAGAQGEAACCSTPVQLPSKGRKSSRRLTPLF